MPLSANFRTSSDISSLGRVILSLAHQMRVVLIRGVPSEKAAIVAWRAFLSLSSIFEESFMQRNGNLRRSCKPDKRLRILFLRFWGSHESTAPMAGHLRGKPGIRLAPAFRPASHDAIAW